MANTVFHIEGGIGKNIAATAVTAAYKKTHPKRKIIVVTAYPEVWMKNPDIARFYTIGNTPYFYQDVIKKKGVEVYCQDPYRQTGHITKKTHLVETWCDMVGVKYGGEKTVLNFNFREIDEGQHHMEQLPGRDATKPLLIFQPFGGPGKEHGQHPYAWPRDMNPQQAQQVVNALKDTYNVVHICYEQHPQLTDCIRFDKMVGKKPLFAMLSFSQKRVLIDSVLQHAAAGLELPSTVIWGTTSPEIFGYPIHNNIGPKVPQQEGTIDSYLYDYDFNGHTYQCPYINRDIHDVDAIVKSVLD
tara:strand:- start:2161 stop:3060 length:900 start_codon:yes stop_codon:yes gene_type:complete